MLVSFVAARLEGGSRPPRQRLAGGIPRMVSPLREVRPLTRGKSQQTLFRLGHGHPDGFDNAGTIRSTKHARLAEVCGPPLQPTAKLRHRSCPPWWVRTGGPPALERAPRQSKVPALARPSLLIDKRLPEILAGSQIEMRPGTLSSVLPSTSRLVFPFQAGHNPHQENGDSIQIPLQIQWLEGR